MKKYRQTAKSVALGGVFSALAVAIMSIGSIIPSLDMSSAFIAGIVIIVARMEINRTAPISIYFVSGILALVLLPNRFAGLSFMCFYGLYPIVKEYFERLRPNFLKFLVKLLFLGGVGFAIIELSVYFTVETDSLFDVAKPVLYGIMLLIGLIYDFFLTLVVTRYSVFVKRFTGKDKNTFTQK